MGFPRLQLSVALVVFILLPDGRVETIGGEELTEGQLSPIHRRGADLPAVIRRHMESVLPVGTITSRIRPLMPRIRQDGRVLVPLWATGRIPDPEHWSSAMAGVGGREFGALERLARQLDDSTLVEEARSEFRRTLASDPVSHQLVSDAGRLRALAMDELDAAARDVGVPPVFGLLPERFTIEQLQVAVTEAARLHPGDIQKSSNFRRRLAEFVQWGILVPTHGEPRRDLRSEQKGRPPQLYRFNPDEWMRWLASRSDDRASSAEQPPSDFARLRPQIADVPSMSMQSRMERRGVLSELLRQRASEESDPGATRSAPITPPAAARDDRVERLERMMRTLMGEIADLKRAPRSGGDGPEPSPD